MVMEQLINMLTSTEPASGSFPSFNSPTQQPYPSFLHSTGTFGAGDLAVNEINPALLELTLQQER